MNPKFTKENKMRIMIHSMVRMWNKFIFVPLPVKAEGIRMWPVRVSDAKNTKK